MKRNTRLKKSDVDKIAASSSAPSVDKRALYLKCANLYTEIEEYKEALSHAQQYIKSCPKDHKGYKLLGLLHEKLGSVKEALKAYRRCTELNQKDTEAKESVSLLYCQSKEQLFRKKAWLDKMEKDLPHFKTTRRLKCHVLQEAGKTEELEQYLIKQLRQNSLDVETHTELIQLLSTRATDDALYFCCKLSPLFYQELALLQLSFSVVSRHLSNNKIEYHMAEAILKTCNWVVSAVVKEKRSESERRASWVNFDSALYQLSHNLNVKEAGKWGLLARECLSCLWLWVPDVVGILEGDVVTACAIVALSAPLLDLPHSLAEMSLLRTIKAGVIFTKTHRKFAALHISSIISRFCSSQAQLKLLQNITTKATSYCCESIIRNVTVPAVPNLSSVVVKYLRLRPRELDVLIAVLVATFEGGAPTPAEEVVGCVVPKLKLHPQSLELVHTLDLCQDDIAALLHLLMKFPDMCRPSVRELWDEVCYLTKIVPSNSAANSALVKKGMWAIRGLANHGLGPRECIVLAKYFSHRAALLSDEGGQHYEKFQQRSAHYWKVSYNIVTALQSGTYKRHNNTLFNFPPIEESDLSELVQESGLAHAGALVNNGKFAQALAAYETIDTPQSAFNAAQVYMHLGECSSTPKSKAKHQENAQLQLQICKERAHGTGDQEILTMVGLIEDSIPNKMRYVTKRGSFDTPAHTTRYETCPDTPFLELDAKAKRGSGSSRYQRVSDSLFRDIGGENRNSVIKQLDFSPKQEIGEVIDDKPADHLSEQLQNLSFNLQKQLEQKDDEVTILRNELLKLRDELTQVKSDVSQLNSPSQGTVGLSGMNRAATPLWMRSDLPAQPSPGSPLVVHPHHPPIYHSPAAGYSPATGYTPAAGFPPVVTGYPAPPGLPGTYQGGAVPAGFHLAGYPGYTLDQSPQPLQQTLPRHNPIFSPAQLQYPTIPINKDVPVPEAYNPNVLLSETLEPSTLSDTIKTDPVLKLKEPAEVLASTPIVNRLNNLGTGRGVVFDSSAIKLPDLSGGIVTSQPGKFSTDTIVRDKPPDVAASQHIEPGYFSCLLNKSPPGQEEEEEVGCYYDSGEEEEASLLLGKSHHFQPGSFTATAQGDSLLKSNNSMTSEPDTSLLVPQVTLKEVTVLTTGEEGEECVFECRAKLFRFTSGEWKERGVGELKILRNQSTSAHRIVMRRDFVLNLCANHLITEEMSLKRAFGSDKAWVWFTPADMANDEVEAQQLAARLKTKEIALQFKEAFDKAKRGSKETTDDVTITYEAVPSEEEMARAHRFLLPHTFYLPPRAPCPGCRGCEEEDDEDEEVVFVKEVLPTTPLKQLAALYQLPPSFYNKRNADCKGCIGCLTDDDYHVTTAEDGGARETTEGADARSESPEVQFIREILPNTPLKELAEQYMLPPSFYNVRYGKCKGCPGCHDDADYHDEEEEEEVVLTKEVLPATPLKKRAAQYKLPPSFYNQINPPCPGCAGCEEDTEDNDADGDESVTIIYEKPARDPTKAALFKLPPNFYDLPEKPCSGCVGCPDLDDIQEITYPEDEEDEDEDNYIGCARSDPNEPVSEKPLYDDLWPEEIEEEDRGQFFSPVKQAAGSGEEEKSVFRCSAATLSHFHTRRRDYIELGTGTLSILSSLSRTQYRVIFLDSASNALCASHAIEGGMYVELVPNTRKLCWFVPIDYTDPETPLPRRFMVELEEDEESDRFKSVFMKCSREMQGHVVNHKLVSLLAAGSPRKEGSHTTPKTSTLQHSPVVLNPAPKTETPVKKEPLKDEPVKEKPVQEESVTPIKDVAVASKPDDICANLQEEFDLFSKEMPSGESRDPSESRDKDGSHNTSGSHGTVPHDKSVEIVGEVLPSAEDQAKETELSLPKGFFNYLTKEDCQGCVGCDDEEEECVTQYEEEEEECVTQYEEEEEECVTQCDAAGATKSDTSNVSPPAPSLYQAIPALNPASQANPFGLKPVNSFTSVSTNSGAFGITPNPPQSSPFASHSTSPNIFLQDQTSSGNIFLQGSQNESNIFLSSPQKEENIFLKSAPKEENIFMKSAVSAAALNQPATINPFASPPLPAKPSPETEECSNNEDYYEEDYYEDEYGYNPAAEEDD